MTKEEIRNRLISCCDEKYKKFNEKLKPTESETIGVRMDEIRRIAKELAEGDWEGYVNGLAADDFFEEKLIAGMSIFYSKAPIEKKTEYTERIIPFIDGWSICDSICMTVKLKKNERECFWSYIYKCAYSGEEFCARFGLVSMLHSFVDEEHIGDIIKTADSVCCAGYYDMMAAAWLLAECMAKFPDETFEYMKDSRLDAVVYNKAITKMRESYRVSEKMKDTLKQMMK